MSEPCMKTLSPSRMEVLETRRMLSAGVPRPGLEPAAYLDGTVLQVVAARAGSAVEVTTRGENRDLVVAFAGRPERVFSRSLVSSIRITGSDRGDRITVREPAGRIDLPLTISCRGGNDLVDLDQTPARVSGGSGNDTLLGSAENDRLVGDGGNDRIFGGGGNDLLIGGSGHDDLRGDDGDDELYGHSGNDTLDGGAGSDLLDGGSGRNRLVDYASRTEINTFFGGKGRNTIFGTTTDLFFRIDPWSDTLILSDPRTRPTAPD